ncbi:MAG TPA: hypothetical protein VJX67_04275 [Blastocatellia bacterium]|nr:hypothetical protein [Blastocatellia bacterium]
MKPILTCVWSPLSASAMLAQRHGQNSNPQFEYGSINELRGVTRVYVYRSLRHIRNSIVRPPRSICPRRWQEGLETKFAYVH